MVNLFVAYYKRDEPELILYDNQNFDFEEDIEEYLNSQQLKQDLYIIKLSILEDYYGDKYKSEIVDNQHQYETFFNENFVYNYFALPYDY